MSYTITVTLLRPTHVIFFNFNVQILLVVFDLRVDVCQFVVFNPDNFTIFVVLKLFSIIAFSANLDSNLNFFFFKWVHGVMFFGNFEKSPSNFSFLFYNNIVPPFRYYWHFNVAVRVWVAFSKQSFVIKRINYKS